MPNGSPKKPRDKYYIKNVGRNAYIGIGPNVSHVFPRPFSSKYSGNRCQNALVACPNTNPVEFILDSAAADVYKVNFFPGPREFFAACF